MTFLQRSIMWQILLRQLPLLVFIFAGVMFWLGQHLTTIFYSTNLEVAKRSATAVVYLVQASMLSQGSHPVWERVFEKIPRQEGTDIEVLNTQGEVLAASDPNRRDVTHRLSDPPCVICHENDALSPGKEAAFFTDPQDQSYHVLVAPVLNTQDCRTCHSNDGEKLGLVVVRQTLEPTRERIRAIQITLTVLGGLTLLLTMLTFRLLLGRYLSRPLKRLVSGAKAIGNGDLEHTIELPERTELDALADTLNTSTVRLSEMQRELVENERLAAIGETVTGLAHCLKNLLNGLRAGQYVIDFAIEKEDQGKLITGWRVMKKSVGHVENLIFDMLYYAKERAPELKPTNLNKIILEVIETLTEMATGRGVELRTDLDEGIGEEALDPTTVNRAIIALVTNAIDACAESKSGDLVTLKSRATGNEIVLTVEDNGIGMSEAVLSKLFTRFFSTKAARGTGLGLLVVKKITEEHGGRLEFESAPNKGSTFRIRFPRTKSTDQPHGNARPLATERAL